MDTQDVLVNSTTLFDYFEATQAIAVKLFNLPGPDAVLFEAFHHDDDSSSVAVSISFQRGKLTDYETKIFLFNLEDEPTVIGVMSPSDNPSVEIG